jgi:uncharacterized protein (TIGR00725 family)
MLKSAVTKNILIAVIGSSDCSAEESALAEATGREIARYGATLVCGGLGGVMEAACKGARAEGGVTLGILPGDDIRTANAYVSIPVATGLGEARNVIIIKSAAAVIAISGEYGTLSEIAFALKAGKTVVGLGTWELSRKGKKLQAIKSAGSAADAVAKALQAATR